MNTPTINVNLSKCDCSAGRLNAARRAGNPNPVDPLPCDADCPGRPVRIRCEIPEHVTFWVAGECFEAAKQALLSNAKTRCGLWTHDRACPARPVKVICVISGETWAKSEVASFDPGNEEWGKPPTTTIAAMRALWAVAKGLVLGQRAFLTNDTIQELEARRDTVFAKLTAMVRAEEAHMEAMHGVLGSGIPEALQVKIGKMTPEDTSPRVLEAFTKYLIAQVGQCPEGE